jgi:hypothetical protein
VKAIAQKAGSFLICLLVALVWTAAAAELRTWTFGQDGQMKSSSGGVLSFKKKGRIDGAFVRLENTNVILLGARGEYFTIPETNFCEADHDFIARVVHVSEPEPKSVWKTAIERNEIARRKVEAAKLREAAAEKRRLSESELGEADKLEDEAARFLSKANELQSQAQAGDTATADQSAGQGIPSGELRNAAIASGAAQQLHQDAARIQLQAKEKRLKAASLQKDAAQLEQTAGLLETNSPFVTTAPR